MENKLNKFKRPLKFVFDSFRGHKKMFYIFFAGKVIEGIFYVGFPIFAKLEMDQLVEKNEELFGVIEMNSFNIFLVILSLIFGIKLLENIIKSFIDLFEYDYIKMYDNYYMEALYSRLRNVDPGLFLNARNKRFVGDILSASSKISDGFRNIVGNMISNLFVIIGIVTVLTLINIWVLVILIISAVVLYIIMKLKEKYNERVSFEDKYEYQEKIWILTDQMGKNLSNLMSSGGFDLVILYLKKSNSEIKERLLLQQKKNYLLSIFSFITENIAELGVKLIIGYSIFFATTSIGTMTMTLLYVARLGDLLSSITHAKFHINRFEDDLLQLDVFLDLTELEQSKNITLEKFSKIDMKGLQFSYPNFAKEELKFLEISENRIKSYSSESEYGKNELEMIADAKKEAMQNNPIILEDINLTLKTGKSYGLVGKNGAGKTTLITLIQNFFDGYSGSLKFDSYEANTIKRNFYINNISVINQVPYMIEGFTVRENLMLGVNKNYSDEYIESLLDKFNLKKKIFKNRQGIDSRVGYDNDFSGGEKQLIVLIRTILQDKKILIMDEGTNQLDAENEILVMEELLKNKSDKIIIFITHRMTSIRKADEIFCLENGKITHKGTHSELLKGENIYNNFWKKQVEQ